MEGSGSGHRHYGGDRRMEIVSGKGYSSVGSNQIYSTRSSSPGQSQAPSRFSQTAPPPAPPSKAWNSKDSEMKRKKRIAKYKVYTVEGKMKSSIKKGIRWIKNKCSQIVHGY